MIRRGIVAVPLLLLLPGIARAEDSESWTKDGRYFVLDQDVGASQGVVSREIVDLWSDGDDASHYDRDNCMTGDPDPSDGSGQSAADCRREQEGLRADWDAKTARFEKAHPIAEAFASLAGPHDAAFDARGPAAGSKGADGAIEYRLKEKEPLVLRVLAPGRPAHEVTITPAAASGRVRPYWSADGQWVIAVVGDEDDVQQLARVPAIAQVDLLDAGAGAKLGAISGAMAKAGYPPAHQGKSRDAHASTEIYVAKGFEPEGRAIASALGLGADAVKPLTWATRYAVTVVAASK